MNGLPYYKAYPRDFIEGTVGMPLELKGAYRIVIDLIYMHGGHLPDDARYISGVLGCNSWKWTSIRKRLLATGKVEVEENSLVNSRAFQELEISEKFQRNQSEIATTPRKNKGLRQPKPSHTEPDTDKEKKEGASHPTRAREKSAFEAWYSHYPHKVQRGAAEKAFLKALPLTTVEELISGVHRYIASKPPDRQWQNPATWLNGKGWLDAPAQVSQSPPSGKRNYVDVAMDRMRQANGTENLFGDDGNAQRISPRLIESGPDNADIRGSTG
jgi:uncharacterized protein YdaU (DUF1376 family)